MYFLCFFLKMMLEDQHLIPLHINKNLKHFFPLYLTNIKSPVRTEQLKFSLSEVLSLPKISEVIVEDIILINEHLVTFFAICS